MADERQAVTEGILERIWKEEWHHLDLLLSRTGDVQFWADVLRYELDLGTLTKGILRADTSLAGLKDFHVQSMSSFHYAGMRGATNVLRKGFQVGLNVEVGLSSGTTVLHLASFAGQMEMVALLVDEFHADVNREDGHRCCPLHYASAKGHQRVVEFLVSRGGDIGARDFEGSTAAYHARRHHHQPIVSFLLDTSGDGDVLLMEEQSLTDDAHTAARKAIPLYTSVCKKIKRRLNAVLDYEEIEPSSDWNTRTETVAGSQDADGNSKPTDKKKDAKKTEKKLVYENRGVPLAPASLLETEDGHASVSKMQHNNGAKYTPLCDEKRHGLTTSGEDFGLNSDSAMSSTALSERAALDPRDASNEEKKHELHPGRRKHYNEEIILPNDSVTGMTVSHGYESVEESMNMTKEGGFTRRNHVYEEIEHPSDTMLQSEMGLHHSDAFTENVTPTQSSHISNESATTTTEEEIIPIIDISKFVRRPHPYEEIKLPCDELDISKFVRRPHLYEEIKFPCDEATNRIHLDEHQVEQVVRQLLRTEMRKLELLGKAVEVENSFRDSDKDLNGSSAISNFFNVSEIAEDGAPDRQYNMTSVITLRQLQRVSREEFKRFADQLRSTESPLKIGVQDNEDLKIVQASASTLMPSVTGLYDELTICNSDEQGNELGKIGTVKPAPRKENNPKEDVYRKEKKSREDSPTSRQHSTDQRRLEIAEQTTKESKLSFSPLLLRRDPRNRKEKGNESRSPHRSPLHLNAQNDKIRGVTDPKTDQNLQKLDALSVKAGQSQFYVTLAHDKDDSET